MFYFLPYLLFVSSRRFRALFVYWSVEDSFPVCENLKFYYIATAGQHHRFELEYVIRKEGSPGVITYDTRDHPSDDENFITIFVYRGLVCTIRRPGVGCLYCAYISFPRSHSFGRIDFIKERLDEATGEIDYDSEIPEIPVVPNSLFKCNRIMGFVGDSHIWDSIITPSPYPRDQAMIGFEIYQNYTPVSIYDPRSGEAITFEKIFTRLCNTVDFLLEKISDVKVYKYGL